MEKTQTPTSTTYQFLSGTGEMSELTRTKNWSNTSLGAIEQWPQSLRTTLSIILNSKFPMFLWWGKELISFYNDAYRPSLGQNGKHPSILGMPAAQAWPEIWDIIKPLIDQVFAVGEATWSEDQLIPIYRNGTMEDVYWTFSYSPVHNELGNVEGVLVTCNETTEKVNILRKLEESNIRFKNNIIQAPVAMCVFRGKNHIVEIANEMMLELWGKTSNEVMNKPIFEGLPEAKGQGLEALMDHVFDTGIKFTANERPIKLPRNGKITTTYINFVYEVLRETNGTITGIVAIAAEVTEQVIARKKTEENEEKLNIIVNASGLGIWELDLKTKQAIYSERYIEILGYAKHTVLTHEEIITHLHPADLHIRTAAFEEAYKTGTLHYISRIIWKDKSIHWIEGKGKVFYDENNAPIKLMGTLRDVTEEKNYEQQLLEREQKFRLLADSVPQFVWTGDANGNLNYFNKAVYNYSGLSPEKIDKDGWIQIVHPDEREENIKAWAHSITTGHPFLFEHRFKRYDGEYRWQLSRATPQRDIYGNIQMWVGSSTDIQDIKEQDQQKDYFISMASHELKTPVTSIKGYVQILQSMYLESEDSFLKNSLSIIDKQIITLTNLITDLLDVSKIKTGSLVLNKEKFLINTLINEIITEIKHINPDYTIQFLEEISTNVFADKDRIGQVLINFLNNAVKYSPDSRLVKVRSFIKDKNVVVAVEDAGIGINKNDQQKIFERFYRVEGKNEKTFPGFGIGLFIASEIIYRHGGEIGVESELGKGSIFYFSLPSIN